MSSVRELTFMRLIALLLAISLTACGGSSSGTQIPTTPTPIDLWTWISGGNLVNQNGVYGTQGTADLANIPGSREFGASWIDSNDNLWLFGGRGWDSVGTNNTLNDLWKFDGSSWTWVSGSKTVLQQGTYGIKGTPDAANTPGARISSVGRIDNSDNLWLFGGLGRDSLNNNGSLNDLWKFDGTQWTWMSGSDIRNQLGVYGAKGTPAGTNVPGARSMHSSTTDGSGNLWVFGGSGYDSVGTVGTLNDLWKFDGTNWTWVSGSKTTGQQGVYGTKGTPAGTNVPGARWNGAMWVDSSGNLWLFGGEGMDSLGNFSVLNDLWKFDGTNWTWVSGSNLIEQGGVYGTKGTAAASNVPGARGYSYAWTDSNDNLWLFGGQDSSVSIYFNDLWKFDGTNWTWVSGGDGQLNHSGVYGTKGTAVASNVPGSRELGFSWIDSSGDLWLFGGFGYDSAGANGTLNDLWRYQP